MCFYFVFLCFIFFYFSFSLYCVPRVRIHNKYICKLLGSNIALLLTEHPAGEAIVWGMWFFFFFGGGQFPREANLGANLRAPVQAWLVRSWAPGDISADRERPDNPKEMERRVQKEEHSMRDKLRELFSGFNHRLSDSLLKMAKASIDLMRKRLFYQPYVCRGDGYNALWI